MTSPEQIVSLKKIIKCLLDGNERLIKVAATAPKTTDNFDLIFDAALDGAAAKEEIKKHKF